jgi:hypothetical protein
MTEAMDENVLTLDDFARMKSKTPTKHRKSYYSRINEYTLDGEYIRTWNSTNEAADFHRIAPTTVRCCVNGSPLYTEKIGRIFLKEGSSIEERLRKIDQSSTLPKRKLTRVAIKEYDMKGNLIIIYPSIESAVGHCDNNHAVLKVISGKWLHTEDGRIFLREDDDIKTRLELIKQRNYNANMDRSIDMYSLGGKPNGHFRNAAEVADRFHISVLSVLDCCLGVTTRCKGNIFLFSGNNVKERLKLIKEKEKNV